MDTPSYLEEYLDNMTHLSQLNMCLMQDRQHFVTVLSSGQEIRILDRGPL